MIFAFLSQTELKELTGWIPLVDLGYVSSISSQMNKLKTYLECISLTAFRPLKTAFTVLRGSLTQQPKTANVKKQYDIVCLNENWAMLLP